MDRQIAINMLMDSSLRMHKTGIPLMRRLLPNDDDIRLRDHYPADDVVNGPLFCRYFYHCHPPEERAFREHGHFHLFFGQASIDTDISPLIAAPPTKLKRADVVHIAALSVDVNGLPVSWFTVNRWVTDEWLYSADVISALLEQFDLCGQRGDPLINQWLTAMVQISRGEISKLLQLRDTLLGSQDPSGEDRSTEVLSISQIDLEALLAD